MMENPPMVHAPMFPVGNLDDLRKLVEQGGGVNEKSNTLLHLAVQNPNCDLEVLDKLLKHGVDVEEYNDDWDTPLHLAVKSKCNVKIILKLLQSGASPRAVNRDGNTALHIAVGHSDASLKVINVLLKFGANASQQNSKLENPLHIVARSHRCKLDIQQRHTQLASNNLACHTCDLEVMKVLLKNGSDLLAFTENNLLPLSYAFERAVKDDFNIPCINLLIKFMYLHCLSRNLMSIIHQASFHTRIRKASRCLEEFAKSCETELIRLSIYDILDFPLHDFILHPNPEKFTHPLEQITREVLKILFEGVFPIYHEVIIIFIEMKPLISILSELSIYSTTYSEVDNTRTVFLPFYSVSQCVNYFTQQDLVNFVLAYMQA